MKVAVVVHNYFPSIGGTQVLLQSVAEKCVSEYGDEFTIYTTNSYFSPHSKSFKRIFPKEESLNGVLIKRYSFYRFHLGFLRLVKKIRYKLGLPQSAFIERYLYGPWSPSLIRSLNETDADVILASSLNYSFTQYPLMRNRVKNAKPFILQGAIHFDLSCENISSESFKIIQASDIYIANTEYEKKRLTDSGILHSKIKVVGCGVDVEAYENIDRDQYRRKLNIDENEILIGYIGRIQKHKSIDVLIKAFGLLPASSNVKLLIAGHGNEHMDELYAIATESVTNYEQKILFQTDISEDEKTKLFHALDIFVLPSVSESFGIVFLEAWACKKPIIGMNIGAIASVISDNKDGLLVSPNNVTDLADKIYKLAEDSKLRMQLGFNGYQKVKKKYTWDTIAFHYRKAFEDAIEVFKHNNSARNH